MSSELHRRAKELFLAARELAAADRVAWLEEACAGDARLRDEVRSLLESSDTETREFGKLFEDVLDLGTEVLEGRFAPGTLVAGRYEIVRRLGAGGMGEVYLARDGRLGVEVALKFLPHRLARRSEWVKRLVSEARLARGVSHPGVCRVYDLGEAEGELFLSMEYVDGVDFATWLRREGRIPPEEQRRMALELCAALGALHREGVLHRDLKPSNVLVDRAGVLHLADFGLAANLEGPGGEHVQAGSPAYMAPELLRGGAPSVQSDLYSLGLVLYELVARRRPFGGAAERARAAEVGLPAPAPGPEVEPVLARIVQCCLEPDPSRRPDSAQRLESALSRRDPLAAVLELGELPSPEIVATSGAHGLLDGRGGMRLLAVFLLLLALFVPLASRALPVQRAAPPYAPAELAASAEELLHELVASPPRASRAYGYSGEEILSAGEPAGERWTLDEGGQVAGLRFWFRVGDEPLVPEQAWTLFYEGGKTRPGDPPLQRAGSATVVFASDGRLLLLVHAPRRSPSPHGAAEPAWEPLFARAGLDPADFVPAGELLPVESASEQRRSWVDAASGLRVEAGSAGAEPVLFAVLRREGAAERASALDERSELAAGIYDGVLLVLLLFSIPMAWRILRRGGGDPWGALRLALFVLALRTLSWALSARHQVEVSSELTLFIVGFSSGLFDALTAFAFYMAVEPLVRRERPRVLVSWSRALRGRLGDPLVASHALWGAAVGTLLALFTALDAELAARFGGEVPAVVPGYALKALSGPASWFAVMPEEAVNALWTSLVMLTLLVALQLVLRSARAAVVLAVLVIGTVDVLGAPVPAVAWLTLGVGHVLLGYVVLVRFGVLAHAVALFVQYVIEDFPITVDLSAWYGRSTLFALAVVLALVGAAAGSLLRWGRRARAEPGKADFPVRTPAGPGSAARS